MEDDAETRLSNSWSNVIRTQNQETFVDVNKFSSSLILSFKPGKQFITVREPLGVAAMVGFYFFVLVKVKIKNQSPPR